MHSLPSMTRLALAALLLCILVGCRTAPELVIVQSFPDGLTDEEPCDDNPAFADTRTYTLYADFIRLVRMWAEPPDAPLPVFKETIETFTPKLEAFFASIGIVVTAKDNALKVGDLDTRGGSVSFKGTELQHKRVRDLMATLAPGNPNWIETEVTVLSLPPWQARAWGLDGLPPAGEASDAVRVRPGSIIDATTYARLKAGILAVPGASMVASSVLSTMSDSYMGIRPTSDVHLLSGVRLEPKAERGPLILVVENDPDPRPVGFSMRLSARAGRPENRDCSLELKLESSSVSAWLVYDAVSQVRTPVITVCGYESNLYGQLGSTFFAAASCQYPGRTRAWAGIRPEPHCLLVFVTPRLTSRFGGDTPDWPKAHDYTDGRMNLLIATVEPGMVETPKTWLADEKATTEDRGSPTSRNLRQLFTELGVAFPPESKLLYQHGVLISYNTPLNNRTLKAILSATCCPRPDSRRVTVTVARLSRSLWNTFEAETGALGRARLAPETMRAWLRRITSDAGSELISSMSFLSRHDYYAAMRNVLEIPVPFEWLKITKDGRKLSLPAGFGESREIGMALQACGLAGRDGSLAGSIAPRSTRFVGWAEPGVTAGTPVVETIEPGEIKIDGTTCGRWYVAAAGGMPSPESGDSVTVWFYCTDIVP